MFINSITDYIPETVLSNEFFKVQSGISNEDIYSKCGIKERHITQSGENTNSLAISAVKNAISDLPFPINEIDLIIGATYTPYDTVGTLAHAIQNQFNIPNAKSFTVDSACSSFANALEIVDAFFTSGKANKALLVVSENNSLYNDFSDPKSGFLWGDGAAAIFVSKERYTDNDFEVLDITTKGLGNVGKNIEGVCLCSSNGGLKMPFGRDVFQYACSYLVEETKEILKKSGFSISDLDYFIPHQANARITDYVTRILNLEPSQVLSNIELYGNTGSASTPIVLSQNKQKFKSNDLIVISVFGGGCSSGSLLLKKL